MCQDAGDVIGWNNTYNMYMLY